MATGLIKVVVSKKKNATIVSTQLKTLLLSTDRILDMKDTSGKAVFYYDGWPEDLKDVPINYTCTNYNSAQLHWAIKTADTTNSRFNINVEYETRITGGRQRTIDAMVKLFADQIIWGYDDSDGIHSHIIIQRGSNVYRLKTTHTIDDIIRTSSKSESLSRSAL